MAKNNLKNEYYKYWNRLIKRLDEFTDVKGATYSRDYYELSNELYSAETLLLSGDNYDKRKMRGLITRMKNLTRRDKPQNIRKLINFYNEELDRITKQPYEYLKGDEYKHDLESIEDIIPSSPILIDDLDDYYTPPKEEYYDDSESVMDIDDYYDTIYNDETYYTPSNYEPRYTQEEHTFNIDTAYLNELHEWLSRNPQGMSELVLHKLEMICHNANEVRYFVDEDGVIHEINSGEEFVAMQLNKVADDMPSIYDNISYNDLDNMLGVFELIDDIIDLSIEESKRLSEIGEQYESF